MNSGKILWGNVFWGEERFLMRREDAREMSILLTASPGHVSHFNCVTVRWQEKLQQCCIQRARLNFYSCQTIPPISEILQVSAQTTKPPVSVLIFMRWKNAHKLSIVTHIYMIYEYICMYTPYVHMCVWGGAWMTNFDEEQMRQCFPSICCTVPCIARTLLYELEPA